MFMLLRTRQLVGSFSVVIISSLGKDLGVILDSYLSFNDHIEYSSSSLLGKLCQINRVQHLFANDVLSVILKSLVFCKLF